MVQLNNDVIEKIFSYTDIITLKNNIYLSKHLENIILKLINQKLKIKLYFLYLKKNIPKLYHRTNKVINVFRSRFRIKDEILLF